MAKRVGDILEGREAARRSGLMWYFSHFRHRSFADEGMICTYIGELRAGRQPATSRKILDGYIKKYGRFPKLKEYIDRALEVGLGDWEPEMSD